MLANNGDSLLISPLSVAAADQQHVTFSVFCSISYVADLHKNIILFLYTEDGSNSSFCLQQQTTEMY